METDLITVWKMREVGRCPTTLGEPFTAPLSREIVAPSARAPTYHVCSPVCRGEGEAGRDKGQKQSAFACAFRCLGGSLDQCAEVNVERLGDAKKCVDRGQSLTLLDTHDHRVAEAGPGGDFVQRQALPASLVLKRGD